MEWKIEYENDVGANDENFWEWWTVSDKTRAFRSDDEDDAKWLCDLLNRCSEQ